MRIAINGFGRIGKTFLRTVLHDAQACQDLEVVAINIGPSDVQGVAYGLQYDTVMGTYPGEITLKDTTLHIKTGSQKTLSIELLAQTDPAQINWKKYGVDWVVESSGRFTKRALAQKHLDAGAGAVLITAPAHDEDITIIPGVNRELFDPNKHRIVSLGSCTTNALAPLLFVLDRSFGVQQAFMTTTHAYTNTQALLDNDPHHKDPRKSRAAALNIIPTTTGATQVIDRVLPHLAGRIMGCSLRVPVPVVSLLDVTFISKKELSKESINDAFNQASKTYMADRVGFSDVPLVSSDYKGSSQSVILDSLMTQAKGSMGQVFGWYDNEWAYSSLLKSFLLSVQ